MFHLVDAELEPCSPQMGPHHLRLAFGDLSHQQSLAGRIRLGFHDACQIELVTSGSRVAMKLTVDGTECVLDADTFECALREIAERYAPPAEHFARTA